MESRYTPEPLDFGAEYFWRIVEVNDRETPTHYVGDIWRFQVPEYQVIDDFEKYRDEATLIKEWEPWRIPLSRFGSLDLGSIKSMTIGVVEPGGTAGGATGTVFIDLIQIGTPGPGVGEPNEASTE